jgi:hypothetical protein
MNAEAPTFPQLTLAIEQTGASFPVMLLEKHQRILNKIELLWGSRETIKYLNSLLLEDREGREGFPIDVLREIVMIKQVHDTLFPSLDTNPLDPFTTARILPFTQVASTNGTNGYATPHSASQQPEYNASTRPPVAQAPQKKIEARIPWPKTRTQHELLEQIKLLQNGESHIYEQQGKLLGDILVQYHLINEKHLTLLSQMKNKLQHQSIGQVLVDMGIISKDDLTCALCIQAGVIMVDITNFVISSDTERIVSFETVQGKQALPIGIYNNSLYLAVSDPFSSQEKSFFTMLTGLRTELVYAPRNEIINRINKHGLPKNKSEGQEAFRNLAKKTLESTPRFLATNEPVNEEITENDSAIINLVNQIILNALEEEASDIHIELFEGSTESDIRFRRDGHMEHFSEFPGAYHRAVISRIKIMAELDIAEKRHPQDGKITFTLRDGRRVDLRVATLPTIHGRTLAAGKAGHVGTGHGYVSRTVPASLWADTGVRSDWQRQDHHITFRTKGVEHRQSQNMDGGRPSGDCATPSLSGADQLQDRLDLRRHIALLPACRPRHHHDRRDARQGNGQHRARSFHDRTSGALDPAHQFRIGNRGALGRSRYRSVQSFRRLACHRSPTTGTHALPRLRPTRRNITA